LRREVTAMLIKRLNLATSADSVTALEMLYEFYERLMKNEKVRFRAFALSLEDELVVRRAFVYEAMRHLETVCGRLKFKRWQATIS
jgi:hypothetical protein